MSRLAEFAVEFALELQGCAHNAGKATHEILTGIMACASVLRAWIAQAHYESNFSLHESSPVGFGTRKAILVILVPKGLTARYAGSAIATCACRSMALSPIASLP